MDTSRVNAGPALQSRGRAGIEKRTCRREILGRQHAVIHTGDFPQEGVLHVCTPMGAMDPAWLRAIEILLDGQEDVTIVPNPLQLVRLAPIPEVDAADVNGVPENLCILGGYGTGCPQLEPGVHPHFLFVTPRTIVYLLTYCVPGT